MAGTGHLAWAVEMAGTGEVGVLPVTDALTIRPSRRGQR